MNTDLATQLVTVRTAATQHSVQIAVLRKSHEMETSLLAMLDAAVKAPAPAGQGLVVDRTV